MAECIQPWHSAVKVALLLTLYEPTGIRAKIANQVITLTAFLGKTQALYSQPSIFVVMASRGQNRLDSLGDVKCFSSRDLQGFEQWQQATPACT